VDSARLKASLSLRMQSLTNEGATMSLKPAEPSQHKRQTELPDKKQESLLTRRTVELLQTAADHLMLT